MPAPNRNVTQSLPGVSKHTYTYANGSSSSVGPTNFGSYVVMHDVYTVASVRTSGYQTTKGHHSLPFNPYSKQVQVLTAWRGNYSGEAIRSSDQMHDKFTYTLPLTFWMGGFTFESFYDGSRNLEADEPGPAARSRILDKLNLETASTGVLLGEAQKTAAHVARTVQRLSKCVNALKRARFGEFMDSLGLTYTRSQQRKFYRGLRTFRSKEGRKYAFNKSYRFKSEAHETKFRDFLANTWLEYSYGWKPLVQDVYGHMEALGVYLDTYNPSVRRVKARAQTRREEHFSYAPNPTIKVVQKCVSQKWAEYCVEYRLKDGFGAAGAVFGLTNPALIAWELLPFSFVADWFIPVGDALKRLGATDGLVFHRGYFSSRHVLTREGKIVPVVPSAADGYTYISGSSDIKASYFHLGIGRIVLTNFPELVWPKLRDPRSITRAVSAIALLHSLFLSDKPGTWSRR